MPNADGGETREEYEERLRLVRATQIFGDTPTDPTIGDVVVPAHDEEGANVAAAEVASQAEDGDNDAADLSPEEAKRQLEPLDADEVDEQAEDHSEDEGGDLWSGDTDRGSDEDLSSLSAEEKVNRIESASSAEEVDRLAEGDSRVTVQRAADKKRSELA